MSAPTVVVLVGCSGPKLDRAAPARDLYTSALFKKARAYAEALGVEWGILSAKHGLVLPDTIVEPYDEKLNGKTVGGLEGWGRVVQSQIRARWPEARFVFLAGEKYAYCLRGYGEGRDHRGRLALNFNPLIAEQPLDGKQIGERLAWLTREVDRIRHGGPNGDEVEKRECDFCGDEVLCAVSELGHATPARPEITAICASCATWALGALRMKRVVDESAVEAAGSDDR